MLIVIITINNKECTCQVVLFVFLKKMNTKAELIKGNDRPCVQQDKPLQRRRVSRELKNMLRMYLGQLHRVIRLSSQSPERTLCLIDVLLLNSLDVPICLPQNLNCDKGAIYRAPYQEFRKNNGY